MTTSSGGLEEEGGGVGSDKARFWRGRVFDVLFSFFWFWMRTLMELLKLISPTSEKLLLWDGWLVGMKNEKMRDEGAICAVDDNVEKDKVIAVRENVGASEIFPMELWSLVGESIEDNQDWLNFMKLSPDIEKTLEDKKVERLFLQVLGVPTMIKWLDHKSMLGLRQLSRPFRKTLDAKWADAASQLKHWTVPNIYLTNLHKVSKFTRDMNGSDSAPIIPFGVLAGVGSPSDPECRWETEDGYMDQLTVQVFWKAFSICCDKIGHRIQYAIFDIRIDSNYGSKFTDTICSVIITECLSKLRNLKHVVILTNTGNVEKAMSGLYSSIKDSDLNRMPILDKLETLDILTLGEGHPSRPKFKLRTTTFPSRFIRRHGLKLKGLRVVSNLYDFMSMGTFQAPNLERVIYDIHHCLCQGKEADLKAMLTLPVVDQTDEECPGTSTKKLNSISVKVNWQWRTSDISCLFKWLGRNYSDHSLEKLIMINGKKDMKPLWDQFRSGRVSRMMKQHDESYDNDGRPIPCTAGYGCPFPWIGKLKMPPIKNLELISDYSGNWLFLVPFRYTLESLTIMKQEFYKNEEDMIELYKNGLLTDWFGQEFCVETGAMEQTKRGSLEFCWMSIWEFFPKLEEVAVVWRAMNCQIMNIDLFDILSDENDKPEIKDLEKKECWRLTRREVVEEYIRNWVVE